MGYPISKSRHLRKRDILVVCGSEREEFNATFPDMLELHATGIKSLLVIVECSQVHARDVSLDFLDGMQYLIFVVVDILLHIKKRSRDRARWKILNRDLFFVSSRSPLFLPIILSSGDPEAIRACLWLAYFRWITLLKDRDRFLSWPHRVRMIRKRKDARCPTREKYPESSRKTVFLV